MIRIPLRRRDGTVRAYALVDDQDAHLAELRWCLQPGGYVRRDRDGRTEYLHRVVCGLVPGDGLEADHRNRNPLDCRRENLIVTTRAGNAQNVPGRGGSSRFRGVARHKHRWQAYVGVGGRKIKLGYRDTELEAAILAANARAELLPFALPDPELAAVLSSHTGASEERPDRLAGGRVDSCEGMASPSQPEIHRPSGMGTAAVSR